MAWTSVIRGLCALGADVDSKDVNGRTPMELACSRGGVLPRQIVRMVCLQSRRTDLVARRRVLPPARAAPSSAGDDDDDDDDDMVDDA